MNNNNTNFIKYFKLFILNNNTNKRGGGVRGNSKFPLVHVTNNQSHTQNRRHNEPNRRPYKIVAI
jgi:hypothetical protein